MSSYFNCHFSVNHLLRAAVLLMFSGMLAISCQKEEVISTDRDLKLEFSTDSVVFDTVFTSIGSITKRLMVYNKSSKRIKISHIRLMGTAGRVFKMNVDGVPGVAVSDIELAGNDSLFVLLKATIDPTDANSPFVVEDELFFETNGNQQQVKLIAWGQNANYIIADRKIGGFPKFKIVADSTQTIHWIADKPYVVYGYALINSYGTLVIDAGAKIHFHNNSGLWAYADGVLRVEGTQEQPVVFQGDRLDPEYRNIPGQWDRIWLMEGRQGFNHEINYAIIRNGFIGIQVESFLRPTQNQLTLNNTVIENHTGIGLFSRLFAIDAGNVVIANCGSFGALLTAGGAYRFRHTTIANHWTYGVRNTPSLFYNNFLLDSLDKPIPIPFSLDFGNSLIYGSLEDEIGRELVAGADTTYTFNHCLIKLKSPWQKTASFVSCLFNEDPLFRDYAAFNYRPDTLSPVIGKGNPEIASQIPYDLDGVWRLPMPDIGAFQYVYKPEEE